LASIDFSDVTELSGAPITVEQLTRLHHRYTWAANYCVDKDVLEAGCGVGAGLGLLSLKARSLKAGDFSSVMVNLATRHYQNRVAISQFDAQNLPMANRSLDVVLLFEAIYYVPDAEAFVKECGRVLRSGGFALVVTANKDLWDFHPSPHTQKYYGVTELDRLFASHGFECEFFGYQDVIQSSWRQRILRPLKRLAVVTGLMPKTMSGKRWLKRLVFGPEVPMPPEVAPDAAVYIPPTPIASQESDRRHKIVYCAAKFRG
jgi:SAM-dependent methyltransferase